MSLANYTALGAAVTSWMDITATDLTNQIADVITLAESRIFRESRTRDTETALGTAIAAGVIAVPSDYIALKDAYIQTNPIQQLERRSAEFVLTKYPQRSGDGIPKVIARRGNSFIFGPYADSGYTVNAIYYKRLSPLSGANNHALFANNPDLYLFGCLAESEIIIGRDKRIPVWESKYQRILMDVNGLDAAEGVSGSTPRMRVM